MEYIEKSIYSLPEIRHTLKPLWPAWGLTAVGIVCAIAFVMLDNISAGISSLLLVGLCIGACCFVSVLCYYVFGDSHRPYSRELHTVLEPSFAYYPLSAEPQLKAALESCDEEALNDIKQQPSKPELVLVRYSDSNKCVFYSQIARIEGQDFRPLTNIFFNKIK